MARRVAHLVAAFLLFLLLAACGTPPRGHGGDAGGGADEDRASLARGRRLAEAGERLPPGDGARVLANEVAAQAAGEGASARAAERHVVAARLLARVWRVEGHAEDGWRAAEEYRLAGTCAAAVLRATLLGDLAHDASTTYAELHRVRARFASDGACARGVEHALAALEPFRPPASVLDAIDAASVGEGGQASARDAAAAAPPRIVRIDPIGGDDAARVVVQLDRPAAFRANDDVGPGGRGLQTFIDFDGVDVGAMARAFATSGVVRGVRAEATSTGARVVLAVAGRAYRRVFHLVEPFRVVIDIARRPPGATLRSGRAVSRVVLDPGHGGSDPGAIGPSGLAEKDVTLDVARRAAPVLARQGVQVLLTRDDDRFVPLEERTARANAYGADLFVSIHGNSAPDHAHRGTEVYVLDTSNGEMEGRIAARENAISPVAAAASATELGAILATMRIADQATRSSHFAELVERATMASVRAQYPDAVAGGVRAAGFYVLVGARMPAVLVEVSYLSNETEEARLRSPMYAQRLADGIVNAVQAYREGR